MPVQISVRNLTVSDITISDLGVVLTASSDTSLTGSFTPDGVRFSNDLNTAIINNQCVIIDNGTVYDKTQSLIFMSGGGLVSENLTILGAGTVVIASGTNTVTVSGSPSSGLPLVAGSGIVVTTGTNSIIIDAPYNFSFETVISGTAISIPDNQQMIVDGLVDLLTSGTLSVDGTLVLQDPIAQVFQLKSDFLTFQNSLSSVVNSVNNITGAVTITGDGVSTLGQTITITSSTSVVTSFQFFAEQLQTPLESDWAVNSFAPLSIDTLNSGILNRAFDDTTEEGVGFSLELPSATPSISFRLRSRAETAPAATRTVGLKLYSRSIPDNDAVTNWASTVLTDISIPNNTSWQYDEQTVSTGTLGITGGRICQFELTRINPTAGTELVGDWDLMLIKVDPT